MFPTMWGSRRRALLVAAFGGAALACASSAALAQSSCEQLGTYLTQRKAIAEGLSGSGKKKQIDAKVACSGFGNLVANGNTMIKWSETNKDWCRIPDSFIDGLKADHQKAAAIRVRACGAVAKMQQMEKQAREGGGANSGLLGGGGLTGSSRMPQGAL